MKPSATKSAHVEPNLESCPPFFPNAKVVSEASEIDHLLDESKPIFVRHGVINKGDHEVCPHYHPYLELSIRLSGDGFMFADNEIAAYKPFDIFFGSINQPHWGTLTSYPMKFVAVYFLPSVLCPMVRMEESMDILDRFVTPQPLTQRLLRPSKALRGTVVQNLQEMAHEFDAANFGWKFKLQTILVSTLVDILRWEKKTGHIVKNTGTNKLNWRSVALAMAYIRENYSEPIYAKEVASAAGMSESQLRVAFRQALKYPWVHYLEGYRIHRACLLLKEPNSNVTETALDVGFESFSHFNRLFKSFMGVSPSSYAKTRLDELSLTEIRSLHGKKR